MPRSDLDFLRGAEAEAPNVHLTKMGWRHAPHLTDKAKRDMWKGTPPWLRQARMDGDPVKGKGRIYPIEIEEILINPFHPPDAWPRVYGFDPGERRTAALWAAYNPDEDIIYFYSEYYKGRIKPREHVTAIQVRGDWIPGAADPSSVAGNQAEGESYMKIYTNLGLLLYVANNAVEAGLLACWDRMVAGQIRVFRTLMNFQYEFNLYQTDKNGRVARHQADHLLDAMRYVVMSGLPLAISKLHAGPGYSDLYSGPSDLRAGF